MSYTSPRYTYVSSQPAYEKMQEQFTSAASKIATERKRGEANAAKGREGSQAYINKAAEYNSVGNQTTQGAVGKLFEGTGKRVGELIRMTQGTNPQCEKDGNCDVLQTELAELQKGPGLVKNFIENLSDQLDYSNLNNFDAGQNSNGVIASNILSGKSGFNSADGYTYSLEKGEGGSYDIIFKSDEAEFYNPDTGEYSNEFSLNSAAFADMAHNNKSYFAETPTADSQIQAVLGEAGGAGIYKYDEKGNRTGSYDISKFLADPNNLTSYEISKSNKEGVADTFYGVVDIDKLKADNRIMGAIASQLEGFIGNVNDDIAGADDGAARAFYNKVLSKQTDLNTYDIGMMKNTMAEFYKGEKNIDDMEDDEIRKVFGETMEIFDENGERSAFGYRENLTPKQKKLFSSLYTQHMLSEIQKDMMNDFESRKLRINPDISKMADDNSYADV